LWFAIRAFGAEKLAAAVDRGFQNAEEAQRMIEAASNWEIVTPAQMGIVTFRFAACETNATNDSITLAVVDQLIEDGTALVSATRLDGRPALRLCPINPSTTSDDIGITLATLTRIAQQHQD
jgi:glutamate/tyrosine decarboxylase-like PLP-dependent enzyme